jgi:antitoxin FitA
MSSTMVQIRNVPTGVHRQLKARAAMEGLSMSDFILREIKRALERPSRAEVVQRLMDAEVVKLPASPSAVLVRDRRERERQK